MLGDSAVLGGSGGGEGGGSGEAVASAAAGGGGTHDGAVAVAGDGSNSGDEEKERGVRMEEGERSFGGNRWPRQETLALLRIRSDMDVAFRDASVKGPLWEEVSRKLAELGYQRSAKKCKEKFENVYKYHKRTKEGRSGKSDGKTYRFFDQLEALDHQNKSPSTQSLNPSSVATTTTTTVPMPSPVANTTISSVPPHVTVPSTTTTTTLTFPMAPMAMPQGINVTTTPSINLTIPSFPLTTNPTNFPPPPPPSTTTTTTNPTTIPISFPSIPTDLLSNTSSSSTSSDETLEGRRKRKRKWKDFFERLMKEVVEKQEELQKRFLGAIEKREHDRMVREEAWRMQEMQRINREREILAQERSIAAARDAAVMTFLQKIAEQQNLGQALNNINTLQQQQLQTQPQSQLIAQPSAPPAPAPPPLQQQPASLVAQPGPPTQAVVLPLAPQQQQQVTNKGIVKADNNGENLMAASSSRWPKVEVQALIKLRTELDAKYQENGPKGPLWEEISASMRKLGYNRSAKRCKEKWENINKYFKKVKESNKKRPEDSKTCPYFHQLDALYRERNKMEMVKAESMVAPLMVRPEQQWPPQPEVNMEDVENDPMDRHHEEEDDEEKDGEEEEDEEDENGGGGGGGGGGKYEIVASKPAAASVGASAE